MGMVIIEISNCNFHTLFYHFNFTVQRLARAVRATLLTCFERKRGVIEALEMSQPSVVDLLGVSVQDFTVLWCAMDTAM